MVDRTAPAERAALDVRSALAAPDRGDVERIPLPDAPALICAGDVVVRANAAAARLAGRHGGAALVGLRLSELLIETGADAELLTPAGRANPVRVVRWQVPGSVLLAVFLVDVSDLRSAADALRTERRRLTEVERVAGIGSWEFDPFSGDTRWSPGHYEILGIRQGTVVSGAEAVLDVVHPDDRERVAAYWREHLRGGDPIDLEYRVLRPDGEVRVISAKAEAKRDISDRLMRFTGTIRDVTEQRCLEGQLREERRRLADAQRVARIGTWEWDPATDVTVCSDMLCELYGVPQDAWVTYRDWLGCLHPEDQDRADRVWQQFVADHQPMVCEYRVIRGDGAVRSFRVSGAAVTAPDGRVLLVGTAQDITEQLAAQTRIERSTQRFSDLVAVAPVGIGIFDEDERLLDANDALCDLLGYRLDELRGLSAQLLTHPDERAEGLLTRRATQASGADRYTVPQRKLVGADGEPVYCELHAAVSVQDDGRRFWLVVFSDVTERRRIAERLKYQATHDDVTGLPNRAAVKELLTELLGGGSAGEVAVLLCDVDNFARINDSLGHDAGDELLVALARRLRDGLPTGCTAARLSGDVYVVICPDVSGHGGLGALADHVSGLLRTAVPVHGQRVQVSAGIGVAVSEGARAPEDLLRFADAALFQAKRLGPGRVALANAALRANADRQVQLEGQLRDALASDGLVLHFQPVVAADGSVLTAEALVRWPHPERGLLTPDVFLPVAEQGNLLRDLDRWVLRTALREATRWPRVGGSEVAVAVNLAGLVPGDPSFVETVAAAVAESGISWDRVVLELVETSLVDLPSEVRQSMAELVRRGVRFAVDDFGTGYSSLARLKELPAQIVKVDRRFVAGVGVDASDFAVARAVVDMARAMDRSCVAEGVETATQFHVLRGLGVDAYQGWLFSRSVSPEQFRAVLTLGPLHVPRAG